MGRSGRSQDVVCIGLQSPQPPLVKGEQVSVLLASAVRDYVHACYLTVLNALPSGRGRLHRGRRLSVTDAHKIIYHCIDYAETTVTTASSEYPYIREIKGIKNRLSALYIEPKAYFDNL